MSSLLEAQSPDLGMQTLSGILELHDSTEGRIRQFDDGLVESQDDPIVPLDLTERFSLRQGQRLTVNVVSKKPRRRRGRSSRPARATVQDVLKIEGLTSGPVRRLVSPSKS